MSSPLRNISILAAGEGFSKCLGFLSTVYLARILGTAGYGKVGFVSALIGYLMLVVSPGFDTVGTREIAKGRLAPAKIVSAIFFIRSLLTLLALVALGGILGLSQFSSEIRMMLLMQGCALLFTPFMFQFFFRGTNDTVAVAYSRVLQSTAFLILIVIFVSTPDHLLRVPMIFTASTAISLVPLNARILREFPLSSFRFSVESIKEIGRSALNVGAAAILVQVYISFDTILLGYMRPAPEVGVYVAAYKIVSLLVVFPNLIFQAYLPHLSMPAHRDEKDATLQRFQKTLVLSGLPIGAAGYALAGPVLFAVFGPGYESGVVPLRILLVTVTIIYCNVAIANPLLAWGREKEYLFIVGMGALTNITLNFLLIPGYGINGAAVATFAAEAVVLGLSIYARKTVHERIHLS